MKKLRFLFLAVLISCLVFAGCGNADGGNIIVESTNGQLTITGLEAYNGKWVLGGNGDLLTAVSINTNSMEVKLAKISNGSAVLKVWEATDVIIDSNYDLISATFKNYTGNDHETIFVTVCSSETLPINYEMAEGSNIAEGEVEVTFSNGIGSGVFIPD